MGDHQVLSPNFRSQTLQSLFHLLQDLTSEHHPYSSGSTGQLHSPGLCKGSPRKVSLQIGAVFARFLSRFRQKKIKSSKSYKVLQDASYQQLGVGRCFSKTSPTETQKNGLSEASRIVLQGATLLVSFGISVLNRFSKGEGK